MACIHLEIITWLFGDTDHLGIHIITDNVPTLLEIHVNFGFFNWINPTNAIKIGRNNNR